MKKSNKIFSIIIIVIIALFLVGIFSGISSDQTKNITSSDNILVIKLKGSISSSDQFVKRLRKNAEKKHIKGMVVRIDSPGGRVGASQEIYQELKRIRENGKPVVVSMASMCASGGYYIAIGGSKIVANPGTITGSIGVILTFPVVKDLMDKVGVKTNTIKSGEFKDTGNPSREMTRADSIRFQKVIDDLYNQFVDAIHKERGISKDTLNTVADGRVFTGQKAESVGLIDTLGTLQDAISIAGELSNIKGDPDVVRPEKKQVSLLDLMLDKNLKQKLSLIGRRSVNFNYLLQ